MLIGINPLLGPELLSTLRSMGHGDEIAIVDANFPASRIGKNVIRMDGATAVEVLRAVVSVLPIDTFSDHPAVSMAVVDQPNEEPDVCAEFQSLLYRDSGSQAALQSIERFEFYSRASAAFAVVATGERRLFGNILLRKGIVDTQEHDS